MFLANVFRRASEREQFHCWICCSKTDSQHLVLKLESVKRLQWKHCNYAIWLLEELVIKLTLKISFQKLGFGAACTVCVERVEPLEWPFESNRLFRCTWKVSKFAISTRVWSTLLVKGQVVKHSVILTNFVKSRSMVLKHAIPFVQNYGVWVEMNNNLISTNNLSRISYFITEEARRR